MTHPDLASAYAMFSKALQMQTEGSFVDSLLGITYHNDMPGVGTGEYHVITIRREDYQKTHQERTCRKAYILDLEFEILGPVRTDSPLIFSNETGLWKW